MLDEPDAPHVRREVVHLVDLPRRLQAIAPPAQVQELELVRACWLVLRFLDVDPAHPIAEVFEVAHEVMSNKAAGTGHQYTSLRAHLPWRRRGFAFEAALLRLVLHAYDRR